MDKRKKECDYELQPINVDCAAPITEDCGLSQNAFPKEKWEDEPDYTTFRRKVYKGKGAPQGSIYLVIKMKTKDRKFEAAKLIQGGKGEETEKAVAQYLRASLQDKYGI